MWGNVARPCGLQHGAVVYLGCWMRVCCHEEGLRLVWAFGGSGFSGCMGMGPRSRFIGSGQDFDLEFEVSVL